WCRRKAAGDLPSRVPRLPRWLRQPRHGGGACGRRNTLGSAPRPKKAWVALTSRAARAVDAPDPRSARPDVEEDEAVEHRGLALVHEGERRAPPVRHPVRDGHHPGREERGPAREEPEHDEEAAEELY